MDDSDLGPSERSRGSVWRRQVALVVLAVLAFVVAIARLRRVARPTFVAERRYAGGRVAVGPVTIARRAERGVHVGYTVVCDGREVYSRPGTTPVVVTETANGYLRLDWRGTSATETRVLDPTTCAVRAAAAER